MKNGAKRFELKTKSEKLKVKSLKGGSNKWKEESKKSRYAFNI